MDRELVRAVMRLKREGGAGALATIISTRGATPRKAGAKMVVFADGSFAGTVGGGCGEAEIRQQALEVIRRGEPVLYTVDLTGDFVAEEGMVCGGIMEVFVEPIGGGDGVGGDRGENP